MSLCGAFLSIKCNQCRRGDPVVETKPSRASQMHSRAQTQTPRRLCGRTAARHLLSCGGILKLQGEKGKPLLQSVCVCVWASNGSWERSWGCRYPAHRSGLEVGGLYFTHISSFSNYFLATLTIRCYAFIKHNLSSDRHQIMWSKMNEC